MKSNPFGAASTADHVLAGIDLTGKHFLVTGCNSGLGSETLAALAANGAHVIGVARTLTAAQAACAPFGALATPVACDLGDFESIGEAATTVRGLRVALDGIITNGGVANLPSLQIRYGIERQFLVNHVGHFYLVNELANLIRDRSGRIVVVSGSAGRRHAPAQGIMFDNLDGRRFYDPLQFYGQSKLANALHAKELSRRLQCRGIAVNSLHPGMTRGTQLNRHRSRALKLTLAAANVFLRSPRYGAATQSMLAASPHVAGISGEYWSNCRIAHGHPLLNDMSLAARLWDVSQAIVSKYAKPSQTEASQQALCAAA